MKNNLGNVISSAIKNVLKDFFPTTFLESNRGYVEVYVQRGKNTPYFSFSCTTDNSCEIKSKFIKFSMRKGIRQVHIDLIYNYNPNLEITFNRTLYSSP